MKASVFLIVLLACFAECRAQKMPSDYFEEALSYSDAGQYRKAVNCYLYIIQNHPGSRLVQQAMNNLAYGYLEDKDTSQAIAAFHKILKSDFNDKAPVWSDIMESPYNNNKHYASMALYEIYNRKSIYDSALYYLNLANTGNPYEHFCGNAQDSKTIYMSLTYADLFDRLNDSSGAEKALFSSVFLENEGNGEVIKNLEKRYRQIADRSALAKEFNTAVENLKITRRKEENYEYESYFITFRNIEIEIPYTFYTFEENLVPETLQKKLKQSVFCSMLNSL